MGDDGQVKSVEANLAGDFNWMISSKRLYEKREMVGDDYCRCRSISGVREDARASNKEAYLAPKSQGTAHCRAECRIHSPLTTRLSVLRVMVKSLHCYTDDLPTTKTTSSPAETAFNLAHDPNSTVFVRDWHFHYIRCECALLCPQNYPRFTDLTVTRA